MVVKAVLRDVISDPNGIFIKFIKRGGGIPVYKNSVYRHHKWTFNGPLRLELSQSKQWKAEFPSDVKLNECDQDLLIYVEVKGGAKLPNKGEAKIKATWKLGS